MTSAIRRRRELEDEARERSMTEPLFHARVKLATEMIQKDLQWSVPLGAAVMVAMAATDRPVATSEAPAPVDLVAVGRRYSKALDAKPGKGELTRLDLLIDSVADIPALINELEQLRRNAR